MQNEEPSPVVAAASRRDDTRPIEVPAGEWIYRQDDPGADLFIIEEGEVDLIEQPTDEARAATRLGPGDFFGEASICGDPDRGESARAHSDVRLVPVHREIFQDVLRAEPGIGVVMIRSLLHRIDEAREAAVGPPDSEASLEPPLPSAPAEAVLVHTESGRRFVLPAGKETTLGRSGSSVEPDIDLSDIDSHATVSRSHAVILKGSEGLCVVERKPSTNGTFVNGARVSSGVEVPLSPGCRLMIGSVEMTLEVG